MTPDRTPSDPRVLWQQQPTEAFRMSEAQMREHVALVHGRVRRLTLAQQSGATFGILASFASIVLVRDSLMRAGAAILALVFGYMLLALRRAPAGADAAEARPPLPSATHYRAGLERQRDTSRGVRLWGRLVVGLLAAALFLFGFARSNPKLVPIIRLEAIAMLIALPTVFVMARRRAERYQHELDALDKVDDLDAMNELDEFLRQR